MDVIDVFQCLPSEIRSLINAIMVQGLFNIKIIWEAASLTFGNGSVISSHTL